MGANGDRQAAAAALDATLIGELQASVEVGAGTVLLLEGRLDPRARPGTARIELAGLSVPPDAERMPEPGGLGPGDRWWLLLELPAAIEAGTYELSLIHI